MAKKPGAQPPKAHSNVLDALLLHKQQQNLAKVQEGSEQTQAKLDALQKEHEELKKKKGLDDDLHKETRRELESFKSQFDAGYILETKAVKKDTMKRARLAKTATKKTVAKESRRAKKSS